MTRHAPVCIYNDLPPRQSSVGLRSAQFEASSRVDEDFRFVIGELRWNDRAQNLLEEFRVLSPSDVPLRCWLEITMVSSRVAWPQRTQR